MEAARERFFKKVEKKIPTQPSEVITDYCWLWSGATQNRIGHNYGFIKYDRKQVYTHRFSYCLHNNKTFDDIKGILIRHRCDVPNCVNPEHLEEGTHLDNMRDMVERSRVKGAKPGEEHHMAKLKNEQVDAIRIDSRLQRDIAAEYNVSRQLISKIKLGKCWTQTPTIETPSTLPAL